MRHIKRIFGKAASVAREYWPGLWLALVLSTAARGMFSNSWWAGFVGAMLGWAIPDVVRWILAARRVHKRRAILRQIKVVRMGDTMIAIQCEGHEYTITMSVGEESTNPKHWNLMINGHTWTVLSKRGDTVGDVTQRLYALIEHEQRIVAFHDRARAWWRSDKAKEWRQ